MAEYNNVSLKVLVNKKTNKVIFAEAGKDFVDALFSFLTFPLGTIARLVQNKESELGPVEVGCLNSLYRSVANLDRQCFSADACKEMLLRPRNLSADYCKTMKLNIDDTQSPIYYMCQSSSCTHPLLTTFANQKCDCGSSLSRSVYLKNRYAYNGFTYDGLAFIITDDLNVKPNSMHTSFALFQDFGIQDLSSIEELNVNVTRKKVIDLLKCSLLSKSTLTDFFLVKKPYLENSCFLPWAIGNISGTSSIQIRVKLVMKKSDGKILFAQGEGDFADFVISFLAIPLGGIVSMLGGNSSIGCFDGLYKSINSFDEKYLMSGTESGFKWRLTKPSLAPHFNLSKQMFPVYRTPAPQFYCYYKRCPEQDCIIKWTLSIADFQHDVKGETCEPVRWVDPKFSTYVKGPAMFMVTDDLVVAPTSPVSGMSLLNRLKVTNLSDVKEKDVTIGIKEVSKFPESSSCFLCVCFETYAKLLVLQGLSILRASLTSKAALTNGLAHLLTAVKEEI
ncbi:hypothetical protein RJT34_15761 [Clitoria ternatea]|uniref:DUF674 family protein n=1 Tax=Clitoria ternatea TaxID=43366 RepID=A0AAN9J622_CLITE